LTNLQTYDDMVQIPTVLMQPLLGGAILRADSKNSMVD